MARFLEGCTNNIVRFFITDEVSYGMVSLELILRFNINVQAQSLGSMIRIDVQER